LQAHGLSTASRRVLAVVAASLVLVPVNVLYGPVPMYPLVALTVSVVAAILGLGMAALWLSGWPTRRQSVFYIMTGTVSIGGGCLGNPSRSSG
jgi:hypothetical protein